MVYGAEALKKKCTDWAGGKAQQLGVSTALVEDSSSVDPESLRQLTATCN